MPTNRWAALLVLPFLIILVSCGSGSGGGGGNTPAPPATGPYTNASLTGSYVFAIAGVNTAGQFNMTGAFNASGAGTITGGVEDFNSPAGAITNVAITGGSYTVGADGRSTVTLNSASGNITLDFIVISTQSGLAIRFENSATASGTIDLRTTSVTQAMLLGSFAFDLGGVDTSFAPDSSAGVFALDAAGNISGGVEDFNDNGVLSSAFNVNPGTSAMSAPVNGRGTLAINSSLGARNYVYYIINSNHLKLIETDTAHVLAGDSFRQQTTTVSGTYAFTLSGAVPAGSNGIFVTGGILATNGAGTIVSANSVDDEYYNGTSASSMVGGTYSVTSGRGTMSITGGLTTLSLSFYPSTGGLLMIEMDPLVVATGAGPQQSGTPFSNASITGTYGLNFTGVNSSGEIDSIAQFTATGTGSLTGAFDFNSSGSLNPDLALTGTYSLASNGRGTATFNTSAGSFSTIFYMVSNTQVVFIELDSGEVSVGTFSKQQ